MIHFECFSLCGLTVQLMLCCFYCFLVHNRNLRCSFLFVILNRFVFDIFNIFSSDKVIFPVPSHSCHLMPVYLLTDWIFSRRSLLESSTATEQPLRHRRPALGFTSANLVRNKGFSSAPPPRSVNVCVGVRRGFIVCEENDACEV